VDVATLGLKLDNRGFLTGVKQAETSLGRLSKAENKVQRDTLDMGRAFGKISGVLGAFGIAIGAVGLLRGLININREFERLQAQLQTTEGSAFGARKAFDRLEEFAIETPFELDGLTAAFVNLRVRGADPTNENLRALGDIASSFSRDITEVANAVSSATAGMSRPLRGFGFDAQVTGDTVKLSFGGMTKVIGRSSQEIIEAMGELTKGKLAGAMAREMQTVNGIVSNFADNVGRLARKIGGGGGLNAEIFAITQKAEALVGAMADNSTAILQFTNIAIKAAKALAAPFIAIFRLLFNLGQQVGEVANVIGAVLTGDFAKAGEASRRIEGNWRDMSDAIIDNSTAWAELVIAITDVPPAIREVIDAQRDQEDVGSGIVELTDAERKRIETSAQLLAALTIRLDAEQRLNEAQMQGVDALVAVEAALERENALREAGAKAVDDEKDAILELVNNIQDLVEARELEAKSQEAKRDVEDLRREVEEQRRLVAVLGQGADASKRVQQEIARENALREALANTTEEYKDEVRELINELFDLSDAQDEVAKATSKLTPIFENAARGMQSALSTGFESIFEDGLEGFEDFADGILGIFTQLASEIAGAMAADALGLEDILASIQSGEGLALTGTQQIIVGAGLGAVGGGLVAGATGGNERGGQIGGAIGAGIGTAFGGPIGGFVGGAIGGFVGGLFGESKEEKAQKEFSATIDDYIEAMRRPVGVGAAVVADLNQTFQDFADVFEIDDFDEIVRVQSGTNVEDLTPANFLREMEQVGQAFERNEEKAAAFAQVMELAELALEQLAAAQLEQTKDFQADLASREAAAGGDELGAVTARLVREQEKELKAAVELADQGIITQDELSRLAQVLDNELAAAIMGVEGSVSQFAKVAAQVVIDLQGFLDGLLLGSNSLLSPIQKLNEARSQFEAVRERAEAGDVDAARQLPQVAQQLLDISRSVNASGEGFVQDFNAVQDAVTETQAGFESEASQETQMIELQQSSVANLEAIRAEAAEAARIAALGTIDITAHLNTMSNRMLTMVEELKRSREVTR